jgi:methionine sulfoxide reductase heme-binding subunit
VSVRYQGVGWNRDKRRYDVVLAVLILLYLGVFVGVSGALHPDATAETLLIRGLGTCAFILLHVVLSIGPLTRLDRRLLPLLYNRRHLGVALFVVALAHGAFSFVQYHAFGELNPFVSLLVSNTRFESVTAFPFQPLGVAALSVLFLMAATSHDFWLANLTAPVWKRLHMLVYVAYALVVAHVALGVLQAETSPVFSGLVGVGVVWLVALHIIGGMHGASIDEPHPGAPGRDDLQGYTDCGPVDEIPTDRAKIVLMSGERVAIFRYDGLVSAISNVCKHQNGPLGEGRVVDGCVVCPWHAYQYRPADGASPPPFTERVPTFDVAVRGGRVWVHPHPHPAGTFIEPARVDEADHAR